jgi:hypothetical protein
MSLPIEVLLVSTVNADEIASFLPMLSLKPMM